MAARAGRAASASAGSTERSPITPRWHSTKSSAVVRGPGMGRRLRQDSGDLQLDHFLFAEVDGGEDLLAVLVELRSPLGR